MKPRYEHYRKLQQSESFGCAHLSCADFSTLHPTGALVYADQPYANTTGYKGTSLHSDSFWERMRTWSATNVVLVNEYAAPKDWVCVAQAQKQCMMAGGNKRTTQVERLFAHESVLARVWALRELAYSRCMSLCSATPSTSNASRLP